VSDWLDQPRGARDGVTIPTIWVAIVLSILIHAAALLHWLPRLHLLSPEQREIGETRGSLFVHLAPPPSPPPVPSSQSAPAPQPPAPKARPSKPKAVARKPSAPPVIALNQPAPRAPAAPPSAPPAAAQPPAPAGGDLETYIEARRRARAAPAPDSSPDSGAPNTPTPDDDKARTDSIVAGNLASQRKLTFGYDPREGGGVFQIRHLGYDNAEFLFFGWNKEIRRNTKQLIEVRKGNNSDIRIAVVRKMIAIIREYEQGDFLWESHRLGRNVTLSARAQDNSGLEEFMMREFFDDPAGPQ
jgi:hypothetical protein